MIRFSRWALAGFCAASLLACGARQPPAPPVADHGPGGARLTALVERHWDETTALMPWYDWGGASIAFGAMPGGNISPQSLADSMAIEQRYLQALADIAPATLDAESRLTYEMFRRERLAALEGFTYPFELMPVNPVVSMPQQFALMAAAGERVASTGPREFASWRSRVDSFEAWTHQAIANMRNGMRRGYTLPRPLVEKLLPQLAGLGEDAPSNFFNQSLQAAAAGSERGRFGDDMHGVIKTRITPTYRLLHDFLQHEYLPRARTSIGLSALPLGPAWYAYLARRATGGTLTPAQLHVLGTAELERLHARAQAILAEVSWSGDLPAFLRQMRRDPRFADAGGEQAAALQDLATQVATAAAALIPDLPQAPLEIRAAPPFREDAATPLAYEPRSPNALLPAVLYVDRTVLGTLPSAEINALYLREAIPGRHYQAQMQAQRRDLPRFRRFGANPAFVAGWEAYAATLGDELGLVRDAESKLGAWLVQATCAAGLVVDTGIHAQGWTRRAALDYVHAHLPIENAAAEEFVDRSVALPGEALACTVGLLKFESLRALAQQKLGSRFDARAFHGAIVRDGAMPLDLLEGRLKSWIQETAAAPVPPAPPAPAPDVPSAAAAPSAAAETP